MGAERVGCIGRRSPGRSGGLPAAGGAAWGRGRWKIGCPGTGRPGWGRGPAPAAGAGIDPAGAVYTGRGPVCGTISRRGGPDGAGAGLVSTADLPSLGAACFTAWTGGGGGTGAATDETSASRVAAAASGGATAGVAGALCGGTTMRGACRGRGVITRGGRAAGRSKGGSATATSLAETGAAVAAGAIVRAGVAGSLSAVGRGAIVEVAGLTAGAAGLGAAGIGAAGRGGMDGTGCVTDVCWIAFRTSPGREMCERSNLGLISSGPRARASELEAELDTSA